MPRTRTQEHRCGICGQGFASQQGVRAHVRMSPNCRAAIQARNRSHEHQPITLSPPESQQPSQITPLEADTSGRLTPPPYEDTNAPDADPRRARVEDDMDGDTGDGPEAGDMGRYWLWDYPEGHAGEILRTLNLTDTGSRFENIRHRQRLAGKASWDPFVDKEEWELARWLVETSVSQRNIDKFLKLEKVNCTCTHSTLPLAHEPECSFGGR